jgi:hypothetical protein
MSKLTPVDSYGLLAIERRKRCFLSLRDPASGWPGHPLVSLSRADRPRRLHVLFAGVSHRL